MTNKCKRPLHGQKRENVCRQEMNEEAVAHIPRRAPHSGGS